MVMEMVNIQEVLHIVGVGSWELCKCVWDQKKNRILQTIMIILSPTPDILLLGCSDPCFAHEAHTLGKAYTKGWGGVGGSYLVMN